MRVLRELAFIESDTMMDEEKKPHAIDLDEEKDEVVPFKYTITTWGVDYPVDGLVKRMAKEDIFIPTFQRAYVWTYTQACRFMESLLLGLPVPGIFLSKERDTNKLLVIDGQQRLRTLQWFYQGVFKKHQRAFQLQGVQKEFEGLTYETLRPEDRRRLDDALIRATIIRQDQPSEDDSSIYHIFERLNTGGTLLHPQEIRACLYHGPFNEMLNELNKNHSWRKVYAGGGTRMRDQELILRFLALKFNERAYSRPMKEFLNDYMGKNRKLNADSKETLSCAFSRAIEAINGTIGEMAFRPKGSVNAAVFDSVMVGVSNRLDKGEIREKEKVRERYDALLINPEFVQATTKSTADEENVKKRIELATTAFADIS